MRAQREDSKDDIANYPHPTDPTGGALHTHAWRRDPDNIPNKPAFREDNAVLTHVTKKPYKCKGGVDCGTQYYMPLSTLNSINRNKKKAIESGNVTGQDLVDEAKGKGEQ